MNSYTIKSLNRALATVEYTINSKTSTEKYDARHLPVDDAVELDMYFQKQLAGSIADATEVELPTDVVAMVNVKKGYDETKLVKSKVIAKG